MGELKQDYYSTDIRRTVVRPGMMYGLETGVMTKRQGAARSGVLEVAKNRMLRFCLGMTRKDKIRIRNEDMSSIVH